MTEDVRLVEIEGNIEDLALELANQLDEGITLVVKGEPDSVKELLITLRRYGANWLKVVYAPAWDDLERYLRYARYMDTADRAPYRVESEKKLKRRVLLHRMAKASFDYMDAPIVDRECVALKYCSLCVDSCPEHAIIPEKPVRIDLDKCTECGACINSCPAGFLWPPGFTLYGLSEFLEGVDTLTASPLSKLDQVREGSVFRSQERSAPLIVILETENRGARFSHLGLDLMNPYLEELESLPRGNEPPVEIRRFNDYASREASLLASRLPDKDEWIRLNYLNYFRVKVSDECTLCEACTRVCPSRALRIVKEEDSLKLEFSHQQCIGCDACRQICPENAITIERALNPHLLRSGEFREVTRDKIARCRGCGAPLNGTVRMMKKLEERIREKGDDRYAKLVWYCQKCKDKILFEGLI